MGMGTNDIYYPIQLRESGVLQKVERVCDIGASQFYCKRRRSRTVGLLKRFLHR